MANKVKFGNQIFLWLDIETKFLCVIIFTCELSFVPFFSAIFIEGPLWDKLWETQKLTWESDNTYAKMIITQGK